MAIEERKLEIKNSVVDSIEAIAGRESAITKIATAVQRAEALKLMAISAGIITTKSAETQAKAAATFPPPFNIPFILMAVAQFASILSLFKKAKKFKHGTKGGYNTPDSFITSEAGAGIEAIEKNGKFSITTEPTLHTGMRGARVYSNPELVAMTRQAGSGAFDIKQLRDDINSGNRDIVRTIKNKRELIIDGKDIGYSRNNQTKLYIDQMMGYGN